MKLLVCLAPAVLLAIPLTAQEPNKGGQASEVRRIGAMVLEVTAAIEAPERPESLETIARHGTDSRHYVMIRGWLREVLAGVESQLSATRDPAQRTKLAQKRDFLRKAIRRIDLE